MRRYENIIVIDPDFANDESEILNRIKGNIERLGGKIERFDDWSLRKLAYNIRKKDKGHYFYVVFEMDQKHVPSLEKFYRTYEPIMRHMIVQLEKRKKPLDKAPEQVTFDEFEGEYA